MSDAGELRVTRDDAARRFVARAEGARIVPSRPFVTAFLRDDPENPDLVADR